MRPKIVVLTLLAAVGLVALAAVLKGLMGRPAGDAQGPSATEVGKEAPSAGVVAPIRPEASNNAAIKAQLHAAEVGKQVDEIRGVVVGGDPEGRTLLLAKLTDPEPAVRSAALDAVTALNETNAIPRLEEAVQTLDNPREKAAIMDAIAYLKLPNTIPDTPLTNDVALTDDFDHHATKNPAAGQRPKRGASGRPPRGGRGPNQQPGAVPPAAPPPQGQPVTPDPAATPPPQ